MFCYIKAGIKLLRYLNIILDNLVFEHIFFSYKSNMDYNNNSHEILNLKWRFLLLSKRCTFRNFSFDVDTFVPKKKRHVPHLKFPYQSMNLLTNLLNLFQMSGKKKNFPFWLQCDISMAYKFSDMERWLCFFSREKKK